MDARFYTTAARITVGTRISISGAGTLEVTRKDRQVNGLYHIHTRDVYGEKPCNFLDVHQPNARFNLA